MKISSAQITSNATLQSRQNQLYSQIKSLKAKDPKANSAQIQQLQQQLNKVIQQQQSKPQTQSVDSKESINDQTNTKSPSTSPEIPTGKNIDAKA